ncbi:MAG: ATP-binding protein [Schaedlerella sp.]|nr:ATP-binding protein [Lachnospiraceae bacterium]MDY4201913.1 ATP-binding protein [Schaedlerella sp.]
MRARIQKSMVIILTLTLVMACALFSVIAYNQNLSLLKEHVRQETRYIRAAIEMGGQEYVEEMDGADKSARVTLIGGDGSVIYDSRQTASEMENHKNRQEVKAAMKSGTGEAVRMSDSLKEEMYYYAVKLDDGNILRVARTMDSLVGTALQILLPMILVAAVMAAVAYWISHLQTKRLIKPINELDLEHPLENAVYEELTPLLQAIDRQNKEKDAVSNLRKEFSANVSHELKTPLTSISGYAEIMMDGLVRPQDISKFSERIYREARRLIVLVEDIIKLSKLDEGGVGLERETVDLYSLSREIINRLSPQAKEKNVRIFLEGEYVTVYGIRQILDEMIYNLCENAVKYNIEGGAVTVWAGDTLQGPKIVVSDTGIGIPKEHQERIFERFYRVDKSHSKETGGTGLGLSIVKHGALLHGAKISVDSDIDAGTRIEIRFGRPTGISEHS